MLLNDIRVSRETKDRLECFAALFLKWSTSINLVAPSTIESLWQRHIADSAQIFQLHPRPSHWVDIGSGGGFPGVITAIFLAELQDGWVDLVESNQKKAAFLRVALLETGARGSVRAMRVEDSYQLVPAVDCVSARALDDLDGLLGLCQHWLLADNTRAYFHKGRDYRSEIDKARGRWSFDVLEHRSAVEDDSIILEIGALQPRSS